MTPTNPVGVFVFDALPDHFYTKISRPTSFNENLTEHFRIARHIFLVAAPVGALVGTAIAGYDYVVNVMLWERFSHSFPPLVLCLFPIAGMFLTGLILSLFRVPSSSMADEVVLAYHRPDAGVMHASVNLGHIGYSANARHVSLDNSDIPLTTMPVCIELLAPKRILEQFLRQQAKHLSGTTLVMVDGVHISSVHLSAIDESLEHKPHTVEYITGGDLPLAVDHVQAQDPQDEAVG